jgi:uncharacterized protein (DUF58 family)
MAETYHAILGLKALLNDRKFWWNLLSGTTLILLALGSALGSSAARRVGDVNLSIGLAALALLLAVVLSITIVPRLARTVDFTEVFMPVTFRITKAGGLFIGIVFIIAMAAMNTGNNLLFLVLAVFLSAIIASGILSRANLKELSVALQLPDIVYAGTAVLLRITLKNKKRFLPSFSLTVEGFRAGSGGYWWERLSKFLQSQSSSRRGRKISSDLILSDHVYFPNIPAHRNVSISAVCRFPRRGRYLLDGFIVATRFPFGFFKKGRRFQANGELIAYPQPCDIGSFFHLLPFAEGHRENLFKGSGENLYSHRNYQNGDGVRHVDWKASAKLGGLMLKEHTRDDDRKVLIFLDNRICQCRSEELSNRFERAVELAAGLASHFIQEGAEVEFAVPQDVVPLRSGQEHLHRILEILALIEPVWESTPGPFTWNTSARADPGSGSSAADTCYRILLTARLRGTIPSHVWRNSRVEYF